MSSEASMTRGYSRRRGLSIPQRQAAERELEGRTAFQVAEAVGAAPGTVRNWRSADLLYRATVNQEVNDLIEARKARIDRLDDASLDVLEQAIASGDELLALKFHTLHAKRTPLTAPGTEEALHESSPTLAS